jgi:hypothetical protein
MFKPNLTSNSARNGPHAPVKAVCGHQAPAGFQRIAERWIGRRLSPRIDHAGGGRRVFRPSGNEPPTSSAKVANRFLGMLSDDGNRLGRRYVVAGGPVGLVGSTVEIFLDNLLSSREFVAARTCWQILWHIGRASQFGVPAETTQNKTPQTLLRVRGRMSISPPPKAALNHVTFCTG